MKNRGKVFDKISCLIDAMNQDVLGYLEVKLEKREEYAIDYVAELLEMYKKATDLDESIFVSGRGHRKSIQQRQCQEMEEYLERLKTYKSFIKYMGIIRNTRLRMPDMVLIIITFTAKNMGWKNT